MAHQSPLPTITEYSLQEREILLRLAREAIQAKLERSELESEAPSSHLAEHRGAFTSLHIGDRLRGCIGYVDPVLPLYRTIQETAQAAAFQDPRFRPVTQEELPLLSIEISVMSPVAPIAPQNVQVGVHGLVITKDGRRGLLLPQVASERGWDRETFLRQTCVKAGLPEDAWQSSNAVLEAFTAEVFGE
jgi:AmmeMemoRadiSam system protein A